MRNYMVPGQTQASNIKLLLMSKMTYMYIMCFPSLLHVSKNHETLSVYKGHARQILKAVS